MGQVEWVPFLSPEPWRLWPGLVVLESCPRTASGCPPQREPREVPLFLPREDGSPPKKKKRITEESWVRQSVCIWLPCICKFHFFVLLINQIFPFAWTPANVMTVLISWLKSVRPTNLFSLCRFTFQLFLYLNGKSGQISHLMGRLETPGLVSITVNAKRQSKGEKWGQLGSVLHFFCSFPDTIRVWRPGSRAAQPWLKVHSYINGNRPGPKSY